MTTIDEIKSSLDVVELISESVQLRKSGKNYTGFCPFHANTRMPAFVVFPDSGTWRCFGQCDEGGDIFKFVMKKEGWDFPEALRALAEKAGVTSRHPRLRNRPQKKNMMPCALVAWTDLCLGLSLISSRMFEYHLPFDFVRTIPTR
jgi:DNA primase